MRILFLTHSFNSLAQRLFVELTGRGHEVAIEFDIADSVAEEAVEMFKPDLVVAPYLRRAIPESVWSRLPCLVVHPGIVGDRGPSALDRAIQDGETDWGVTVLQANAIMDGGDIWAAETFPMRPAMKSSLYRNEVTEAAVRGVLKAVENFQAPGFRPLPLAEANGRGTERPLLKQDQRALDWATDDTATLLKKIRAGDGFPGVKDSLFGQPCFLFDARLMASAGHIKESVSGAGSGLLPPLQGEGGGGDGVETQPQSAPIPHPPPDLPLEGGGSETRDTAEPGTLLGRLGEGVVRKTKDGFLWIGHARVPDSAHPFKLPVALAFPNEWAALPELPAMPEVEDIRYEEAGDIGFLHFDFYNGAMGTGQCKALQAAFEAARQRPTKVIVLIGGRDFWSNGIHLNRIEAAESPAEESLANIEAMDDLALTILTTESHLTVAALRGNAGAGGCFLALAADRVWARAGVVMNPHYKNMGNLYGSEYWTYSLPKRVGAEGARRIMENRLPLGPAEAARQGLIDGAFGENQEEFLAEVRRRVAALAEPAAWAALLQEKRQRRQREEAEKPLAAYREAELKEMRRNFFGFDPSYHVARFHFVHKSPVAWTPRHLAIHRGPPQKGAHTALLRSSAHG